MDQFKIGDSVSKKMAASESVIAEIARVSGDVNPVHLDEAYAQKTVFGKRIAHGLFCLNGISMVIGNYLPGQGSILVSQTFHYKKPVYIGDTVEVTVCISGMEEEKSIILLDVVCKNQREEVVLTGVTKVKWRP